MYRESLDRDAAPKARRAEETSVDNTFAGSQSKTSDIGERVEE